MGNAAISGHFTHEDFLVWEATQKDKHEFVRGEVFAMVGARRVHVGVTRNLTTLLTLHLKGSPCRAYASDMLVRVEAVDSDFYPDVVVTCDEADKVAERVLTSPTLLVEVLSEATEAFDRGGKFEAYRHITTLREYVLIDPQRPSVECFRLNANQRWELHSFTAQSTIVFSSIEFTTSWADVFADL
ncbi:MAG: Uma2 family endonuclease [Betaproteobacteria bacterium]|nr:Uma2 family endonuclease [Betaproteobacteria bacterium]